MAEQTNIFRLGMQIDGCVMAAENTIAAFRELIATIRDNPAVGPLRIRQKARNDDPVKTTKLSSAYLCEHLFSWSSSII